MSKVRVYELAKEYGMKGPALAQMLKEHGFDRVKSHMAVLDDATALHARAVLEAQGLQAKQADSGSGAAAPAADGMPKKKALPSAEDGGKPLPKPLPEAAAGAPERKQLPKLGEAADAPPAKKPLPQPGSGQPAKKALPRPAAEQPAAPAKKALPQREAAEPVAAKPQPAPAAREERAATQPAAAQAAEAGADRPAEAKAQAAAPEAPAAPATPKAPATPSAPAGTTPSREATKPAAPSTPAARPAAQPASDASARPAPEPAAPAQPKPEAPKPPAGGSTDAPTPPVTETSPPPAAAQPPAQPAAPAAPAAPTPAAASADGAAKDGSTEAGKPAEGGDGEKVKKLLVPEAKAKVVGRIELSPEAIRDAQRRSSPGGTGRGGPGGVGRDLRRGALRSIQSRSAAGRGGPPQRGGPGMRRGPGVGGRGRAGGRSGRRGPSQSNLSSTVDPNKVIEIEPPITVKALSEAIGVRINDLIATLTFKLGVIGKNINSFLTNDEIELVGLEVKRNIKLVQRQEAEAELLQTIVDAREDVDSAPRAPVVTFMGHVDHGKTTLLDAFRESAVTEGEAGGITQHVGAYKVYWGDHGEFVILDTPGHAAFTQMRARGAKITDIVVLIVAADDGVMPQTEEAISHAKEADVQMVVAITKCDRPEANPMQVRQQLAVKGLQPEDWGGDVPVVEVSAMTGQGMDDLVEQIMLRAEVAELSAKPDIPAEAVVIESKQTPEQGVTVNVLVSNGTLRLRDQVLCGESLSRVRGIVDDRGNNLEEALPSTPVQLLGITSLPSPGDKLYVVNDKKKAREVVEDRERHARRQRLAERSAQTLENLQAKLQAKEVEEIKVIIKADVMGSLEPIKTSLGDLGTDEVRVNVIHSALGGITETDVSLAEASGAMIIGFNSVADSSARQAADRASVDIRFYSVIYELVDEVKLALEGKLKPDEVESALGSAEIRAVFRSSKFGNIAGCYVTDGVARRNASVRLSRDGKVVYQGTVASLRRESEDAREVRSGFECGMTLKDYNDIKEGDRLDFYEITLVKRTLE